MKKTIIKILYLLCMILLISIVIPSGKQEVCAKETQMITSTNTSMVCGAQAKIQLPSGFTKCKFTSSNKKIATVTSKGVVKTSRLGVVKITAKSGKKTKTYTITVKPEKKSDVWLNHEILLTDQKVKLKLESDKYDTSQVKMKFNCGFSEIKSTGECIGRKYSGWATLDYSYGSFSKRIKIEVHAPDEIVKEILRKNSYDDEMNAGNLYKIEISSNISAKKKLTPELLRAQGISLLLDGKEMPDNVIYTPGKHVISVVTETTKYEEELQISYSVKDALIKKDATGFSKEGKQVFDKAFEIVNQIITDGMSEEEKVKAIHDYLIYHANYVNNGDYSSAEKWAYGAGGVLLHGEGVCQSYSIAFYMMATASGLECEMVRGTATNSVGSTGGHAWNRVSINGVWYYIDCTWDDPTGGGHERYTYYLSETLWSNHIVEKAIDLASKGKYYWENHYLTGKKY